MKLTEKLPIERYLGFDKQIAYNKEDLKTTLTHHGIPGQEWGKRNGPPYPLGASDRSQKERSAEKRERNSIDSRISAGQRICRLYMNKKVGSLSPEQTMVALDAVMVSIALLPTVVPQAMHAVQRIKEKKDNKNVTNENDLPKKTKKTSKEDDMKSTNPKFGDGQINNGYVSNCMFCSAVYDLRRRGYDVTAHERKDGGNATEAKSYYVNPKMKNFSSPISAVNQNNLMKEFKNQPDGSRGALTGSNRFTGHSVAYEKEHGKVKIYDSQIGEKYSLKEFMDMFPSSYTVMRTDNLEINWKNIGQVIDPESLKNKE